MILPISKYKIHYNTSNSEVTQRTEGKAAPIFVGHDGIKKGGGLFEDRLRSEG
jgi:hypothetical protein